MMNKKPKNGASGKTHTERMDGSRGPRKRNWKVVKEAEGKPGVKEVTKMKHERQFPGMANQPQQNGSR